MAAMGTTLPTLLDVAKRTDPNGKIADIAELLTQYNEILQDMTWKEGNLPTGERTTVRIGQPAVGFRRLNEGIPISKSLTAQVDEGAAMLEAYSRVDRKVAILSDDIAGFRLSESVSFLEAMNQRMALTVFYGNAGVSQREFTGLAPRYNSLSATTGQNILSAGGSGAHLRSMWLVVWDPNKVTGIYPKGTKAGLQHDDVTSNLKMASDGAPIGDTVADANGNLYQAYTDHYSWDAGMSVKDWRYAVRIPNIDLGTLTKDASAGADLIDLMIQASERVQSLNGRAAFYAPRQIRSFLRRQIRNSKNMFLTIDEVAGQKVLNFDGVPVRRVDMLNVDETQVS